MNEEIKSIQDQIAAADAKKAALEAELEARTSAAREAFVERVKADAEALKMTTGDLIAALGGKAKSADAPRKASKVRQARVLKSDPSKVYKGGALPAWMKEAMLNAGYHQIDKDSTRVFIDNHMQAA